MAGVVGEEFEARALPCLHRKLFVEGQGRVAGMGFLSAQLAPGHYLRTDELGPATALALWDVNARAASLAVFSAAPSEHDTRRVVDGVLELGGSLSTLRFALVGGSENRTLRSVWLALDKRLGLDPLPPAEPGRVWPGPRSLFHGEQVHVVFNGAASWLGRPDV